MASKDKLEKYTTRKALLLQVLACRQAAKSFFPAFYVYHLSREGFLLQRSIFRVVISHIITNKPKVYKISLYYNIKSNKINDLKQLQEFLNSQQNSPAIIHPQTQSKITYNCSQSLINKQQFKQKMAEMERQGNAQDQRRQEQEQYNSFLYKFEQQIIDAWKPVPYTRNNVILYSVLTVVCVVIGLVLLLTAPKTPEIERRYDDDADGDGSLNSVTFQLTEAMEQPIYLYYGFTNYYQNHRRYLKYFSVDQMNGKSIDQATAIKACGEGAYTNQQLSATVAADGNTTLNPAAVAHPCGQRAKSYLKLKPEIDSIQLLYSNGSNVVLNRQGVSWPDDSKSYKDTGSLSTQAISNLDEAWLVWFRPAAKNYFYKLHSRIESNLAAGNYTFKVTDKFDVSFGVKNFYLSKSNYMGNKDYFLGIAFLVLGGGCLIVLIIFIAKCVTEMRGRPKEQ